MSVKFKEINSLNSLVHKLCEIFQDEEDFVLLANPKANVYLVPVVLTEESTEFKRDVGKVEYQVSNGMPGNRDYCEDFFNLHEAIQRYHHVVEHGWKS